VSRWTSSRGAQLAAIIPLLASAGPLGTEPPPTEPLAATVIDVAPYPRVVIDVVVPWQFRTADIEPSMIELEDATIDAVVPVDPTISVVGLVIDDGPTVHEDVVQAAQGASVDLVRNLGVGTAIALSTPSGMQTTPTTDQGANIARIAGMTAGAPDVVPLHRLVVDAAERLADEAWPDRHLVLVLGRPISEAPTLRALADIAAEADMRLHVIADPGIDTGTAARLAERTGGVASSGETMLAEVDQVTAAIADRVRVAATVSGTGPHELVLTLDGTRFVTEVNITAPSTASPSSTTTPGTVAAGAVPLPTTDASPPGTRPTGPVSTAASVSGADRTMPLLIVAALAIAAMVTGGLRMRARRRAAKPPEIPARRPRPATRVTAGSSAPTSAPAHRPPEPESVPVGEVATPDDEGDRVATGAAGVGRRPVGRPRRATPRRRPATDVSPPPEPAEQEPENPAQWLVVDRLRLNRSTGEVFSGPRRITLTPGEFAVLELLMTDGGHGVTRDAISAAASPGTNGEGPSDPDAILEELRRKTGIRGRRRGVRSERTLVYFLGD
jgi:hypothetical protein